MLAAVLGTVLIAGVAATTPATADTPRYRVVDLGAGKDSEALAINSSGHVVGNRSPEPFVTRPFLWRDGEITELIPAGELGRATDINDFGDVVGYRIRGQETRAFVWRGGVLTDLGGLPGATVSYAQAINNRGDIVGWSTAANSSLHAVRWRDGVITDLGTLPNGSSSVARDVNNDGDVVGDSGSGFKRVAARWNRDGVIEPLTELSSTAMAISDSGAVTGLVHEGNTHGFLLQDGQFTEIQPPPGSPFIQPYGINNRAEIVGDTERFAFYWHEGELIELPNLVSTSTAYDINNDGLIVGASAANPGGLNRHAVLWSRDLPSSS